MRVGGKFEMKINASKFVSCVECKDHMYRMVIVEGRCTMARSSSLVDTNV